MRVTKMRVTKMRVTKMRDAKFYRLHLRINIEIWDIVGIVFKETGAASVGN